MIRIGLTGGMGAGKSSVARYFKDHGIAVLDADQVARSIVAPGSPCLLSIVEAFGPSVMDEHGALRRKVLGALVAENPSRRKLLEEITHPAIREQIVAWMNVQESGGTLAAVVEAALMVETGSYRQYDALIVVSASADTRIGRIMRRDGLDENSARSWLEAQLDDASREAHADWVIHNERNQAELNAILDREWPPFVEMVQRRVATRTRPTP